MVTSLSKSHVKDNKRPFRFINFFMLICLVYFDNYNVFIKRAFLHHYLLNSFNKLDKNLNKVFFIPSAILKIKITPNTFYKIRQMNYVLNISGISNPRYGTSLYSQTKNGRLHCIQSNLQHLLKLHS